MSGIAIGWRASDNWEGVGGGGGGGRGLPSSHCGGRGGGGLPSSHCGGRGGGGLVSSQHGRRGGAAALSMGEWGILTSSWTERTPAIEDENGTAEVRHLWKEPDNHYHTFICIVNGLRELIKPSLPANEGNVCPLYR